MSKKDSLEGKRSSDESSHQQQSLGLRSPALSVPAETRATPGSHPNTTRPITWRALQSGPRCNASERLSWLVVNPRLPPESESDTVKLHNPRQGAFDVVFGFYFRVCLGIFACSFFYWYWAIFVYWVRTLSTIYYCVFVSRLVSSNEHVVLVAKG